MGLPRTEYGKRDELATYPGFDDPCRHIKNNPRTVFGHRRVKHIPGAAVALSSCALIASIAERLSRLRWAFRLKQRDTLPFHPRTHTHARVHLYTPQSSRSHPMYRNGLPVAHNLWKWPD